MPPADDDEPPVEDDSQFLLQRCFARCGGICTKLPGLRTFRSMRPRYAKCQQADWDGASLEANRTPLTCLSLHHKFHMHCVGFVALCIKPSVRQFLFALRKHGMS